MQAPPIYLDNHATTRVDPRVLAAMWPYLTDLYGNAGSTNHPFGWDAREAVADARRRIAACLGAAEREIIFTSGATESNNLALKGIAERSRRRGHHLISVRTEHKAVLDPLARLSRRGFEVTLLDVEPAGSDLAGWLDPQRVADAVRPETILVSVMLANNEIGVVQPLAEIAAICRDRQIVCHCDATQAVGKIPVDLGRLPIDLLSFSAHKIYGPKGVGALFVRRRNALVRLEPQLDGGGQEFGFRSGTLNVPGIVGFATALELCGAEQPAETSRLSALRDRLFSGLRERITGVELNGPALAGGRRLAANLNCRFGGVDGEALMMSMREVAVSSGSACTSTDPEPSHVLRALGLPDDEARASLRFGLGRFNSESDIDRTLELVGDTVQRLRSLGAAGR